MSVSNQIKKGALMSYVGIAFNILAGLLYTPWMVSIIGQADYGLYTLSVTIISFFSMDFGLSSAVSRFLSKYKADKEFEKERRFVRLSYKIFGMIALLILVILSIVYLFIDDIYMQLSPTEISKLKVLFVVSGIFSVISFLAKPLDGILIANERFFFNKLITLLRKVFIVILMVIALYLGFGVYTIVIVNALVGFIVIISKFIYVRKTICNNVAQINQEKLENHLEKPEKNMFKDVLYFSGWTTLISISQRFILNITPTVLGALAGSVQIAIFSVGMTIEGYTWTISNALSGLFLPKVTRMTISENSEVEIERLMLKVGRLQLYIIGLIIIGFATMGKEFVELWMGQDFKNSYYVALLLVLPKIISTTQSIADTALIALNKVKFKAYAVIATAIISISFSIFLASFYGAIGSAIAIFTGNIVGAVVLKNILYYKVLKINVLRFFKECHLKIAPALTLIAFLGFGIQKYFPTSSLVIFMLKAIFLGCIYFTIVWMISFNNYEKNLILKLFNKT